MYGVAAAMNRKSDVSVLGCAQLGFPQGSAGKESACNAGDLGTIPSREDSLEKGMATHSSVLAWRIPWIVV